MPRPSTGCDYTLDVTRRLVRRRRPRQVRRQRRHLAVDAAEPVRARAWRRATAPRRLRRRRSSNIPEKRQRRARHPRRGALGAGVHAAGCRCRDGKPLAGMAHHKMHDTGVDRRCRMLPDQDPQPRYPAARRRTAATLNLAATAAQCARIWRSIDPTFVGHAAWRAAETAWAAAKANPAMLARARRQSAAARTTTTTSATSSTGPRPSCTSPPARTQYTALVEKSPHYKKVRAATATITVPTSMTGARPARWARSRWRSVPNGLPPRSIDDSKARDQRRPPTATVARGRRAGRLPAAVRAGQAGGTRGARTRSVLNNTIILALAYDFTGEPKYLNGVARRDELHPRPQPAGPVVHHRLRRAAADRTRTTASGRTRRTRTSRRRRRASFRAGRTPASQDPYVQAAGLAGCAPQKCFVDHIEAWSTNEMTINWNAPLAWVAHSSTRRRIVIPSFRRSR